MDMPFAVSSDESSRMFSYLDDPPAEAAVFRNGTARALDPFDATES
jgi:hypothetical protein